MKVKRALKLERNILQMSDESIQKLLASSCLEDLQLGRIYLLKKYPYLVEISQQHWGNNYTKLAVRIEDVEKHTPIIMPKHSNYEKDNTNITGFVIQKALLND